MLYPNTTNYGGEQELTQLDFDSAEILPNPSVCFGGGVPTDRTHEFPNMTL